jgi:hypothetical protein
MRSLLGNQDRLSNLSPRNLSVESGECGRERVVQQSLRRLLNNLCHSRICSRGALPKADGNWARRRS